MKVVLFSAPWCGPCKTYKPLLKAVLAEHAIELEEVNIEEQRERASTNLVRAVPTTVLYFGDREQKRVVGAQTKNALERFLALPE